MQIEDGLIWVYGVGEDGVQAFTDFGIENLEFVGLQGKPQAAHALATGMIIARRSGSEERGDQDGESVSRRDDDRRDDCRAQERIAAP